jgi:formate transporter
MAADHARVSTQTIPDTTATSEAGQDGAIAAARASFDALLPRDMAAKAESLGVSKAELGWPETFILAVLAGAFIALGAMFATTVTAGASGALPFGITRLLAGVTFCLGLILVVVAGAELFTGNNLIVMAWADRRVALKGLLRNWGIVYAGNLVGATATAGLLFLTKQYSFGDGAVGLAALNTAELKSGLGFGQAIVLGMMCNALVCLAIWLTYSARTVADKILAILFPISAFVAAGFEHSVANMYFLPIGLLVKEAAPDGFWSTIHRSAGDFPNLTVGNAVLSNLLPVTVGNVIGGSVMVGLVYWLVYVRSR